MPVTMPDIHMGDMGAREGTQVLILTSQALYQLSHLLSSLIGFEYIILENIYWLILNMLDTKLPTKQ